MRMTISTSVGGVLCSSVPRLAERVLAMAGWVGCCIVEMTTLNRKYCAKCFIHIVSVGERRSLRIFRAVNLARQLLIRLRFNYRETDNQSESN